MIKLIVSMSTSAHLLSILIRSNHVLFDGTGLLSVLDRFLERLALKGHDAVGMTEDDYNSGEPYGDLGKRLIESKVGLPLNESFAGKMKPWPRDALPTKSHRFRLDKETSKDFLRACKERGLTATYGIGACLILATLELFRTEEEISMGHDDAVMVVTFNLRRWVAEEEGLKGTASSAETGLLIASTGLFDCMIAEGRMEVEHCLWFIAEQLKEFFTDRLKQISCFAGKGAHGFWHAYNQEAAAMASGQSETPLRLALGSTALAS
ncbi:hypothetical protein FA10DRAFT_55780 [Acaromyces ingoldii]|uniref:CoA-dependent acyltransferase n=1 Tax=Acaromyces ingoldii TaxID=215250 RepID=A0A316YC68_9BASI|nr:hypothetical protein FA10DRAFT_55780 [Acaromyces ingoldii]PWN86494.1 hypothetical protein FA10DRAFT_55780 [Acaromyces ingoldii]